MNVLHILSSKNWGGGTAGLENLYQEMSRIAPDVTNILFCIKNGDVKGKLDQFDYKYIEAPAAINADPRFIYKLIKTCRKEKIDLIHLHGPNALTNAVIADKFADLPPMVFSKKTSFPIKKRKQTLYKYNYPKVKSIFCVSKKVYEVARESILEESRLALIYGGIAVDKMGSETPFLLREKYGIAPGKKIIGNIGNHIKAKDLDTFLNLADYLINTKGHNDLYFVQIGNFKEQTPELKEKISRLNLDKHFTFTGFISAASNFLPQFDVLVITSKSEGGPRVLYESIYHKTPVISTEVGAVPEIIDNGINGFYTAVGDHKALAEALEKIVQQPGLGEKFAAISWERLIPKFTTSNTAKATLKEYRRILNQEPE